jgi:myo-inositol-1-phosphate synthase
VSFFPEVGVSKADRIGLWFVGAWGGVATSSALGISALAKEMTRPLGLATEMDPFSRLPFLRWNQVVVGGHDVRKSSFFESAVDLHRSTNLFSTALLKECQGDLEAWSQNVRPGLVRRSGKPVEAFSHWRGIDDSLTVGDQAKALAADLAEFVERNGLARLIVVNISSSEPPADPTLEKLTTSEFRIQVNRKEIPLPASSVYALAAIEAGADYINFTPSLGISLPALEDLACQKGLVYCGKDGKTGETLMKSVLAPMFARRNLQVMSWVGHNILGNRDGLVLQDPENKKGKLQAKDRLLAEILGYEPQTLVSIEYIASLGDRKTAWDHVHFEGFLGTQMNLQFIWQGCDSLLAAPLLLDLVRWTDLARQRRESGCLKHLAHYFKTPMHVAEQDFVKQFRLMEDYCFHALSTSICP